MGWSGRSKAIRGKSLRSIVGCDMHTHAMKIEKDTASRTQDVLACLAVPSRYRLVLAIAEAERCVGELAVSVGLSQSCTTRHLQALERAGLIRGTRDGRHVRFALNSEAGGSPGLLGIVLADAGGDATVPRAPGAPLGTGRGSRGRRKDAMRRYKPLPERPQTEALAGDAVDVAGVAAGRQDLTADDGTGDRRAPASPFRRRDIEDYLL